MPFKYCNVGNANVYREGKFRSEIDTQVVLWEKLEILREETQFSEVRCEDGYTGWVNNRQMVEAAEPAAEMNLLTFGSPVYELPNSHASVIRDVVSGCFVPVAEKRDGWLQIHLPDGKSGFVPESTVDQNGMRSARDIMLHKARFFSGVPYFWGGKTNKGMDCSGYMQLLHKFAGKTIRRDSPMQFEDARPVSEKAVGGQPGDLLFFAEYGTRITHVGLKLSDSEFIHARGMVRINTIEPDGSEYDEELMRSFVAIKTFMD